jgi:Mg2+/Co2+ transporter CorB
MPVVELNSSTTMAVLQAVRLSQSMHFHDIPVYQNNISNIVGILSLEPWEVLE